VEISFLFLRYFIKLFLFLQAFLCAFINFFPFLLKIPTIFPFSPLILFYAYINPFVRGFL